MNASISHQLLEGMHCLHFSNTADGGKKNAHGSLVIIGHVWNPLCTDFLFP